jgi:uncharacterized protein YdiU (UPF0061 family)
MTTSKTFRHAAVDEEYGAFDQLDGNHPWRERMPEGMISYSVRQLRGGKVAYFNFELAKDMGLIRPGHPHRLNKPLTDKLLKTFCLRIINEYDREKGTKFPPEILKANTFMATRYLQLQHPDKAGRTSGDGRAIWNGVVINKNGIWDVSSRGTGVTALAPGVVRAGRPLKSGNNEHGYGCGLAEIDELFGAAILAEIFHRNGIHTERVLAILDLGKGVGIGVRAAPNLIRPAHLFPYLKQGKQEPLKRAMDYLIDRQTVNKAWNIKSDDKDRYHKALTEIASGFARFVARLDRDYIFAWMDWDGDNVLADAGIIDYGSVRQFGLRHDQYRYDDIERMSTNLNEQRLKAREIVQTFAQAVDFIQTGVKKPWPQFRSSPAVREFNRVFDKSCLTHFLFQIGFPEPHRRLLINKHRHEVEALFALHSELERAKTSRRMHKVADGVQRSAIYNMRIALARMASHLEGQPMDMVSAIPSAEFFDWILCSSANRTDRRLTRNLKRKITQWQEMYVRLVRRVSSPQTWDKTVTVLKTRAERINHESRITGNALINIVDRILRYRRRGLSATEIQTAIEDFILSQTLNPDFKEGADTPKSERYQPILRSFLSLVQGYREDI